MILNCNIAVYFLSQTINIFCRNVDNSPTGHVLGLAENRIAGKETIFRSMNKISAGILRTILHLSLLEASNNNSQAANNLISNVNKANFNLQRFFYQHLKRDIQLLSETLARNLEDTITLLHCIICSFLTNTRM